MTSPRKPTDDWLDDITRYVAPWISGAFLLVTCILVPLGSLGVSAYIYLKSGEWLNINTGMLTGWYFASNWIGLNEVGNWALGLWVGWPSLAIGFLAIWLYVSAETL